MKTKSTKTTTSLRVREGSTFTHGSVIRLFQHQALKELLAIRRTVYRDDYGGSLRDHDDHVWERAKDIMVERHLDEQY